MHLGYWYHYGSSAGYQYQGISGTLGQVESGQVQLGQVESGQVLFLVALTLCAPGGGS